MINPETQKVRIQILRELHANPGSFVIANAFDAGSARILQGLGFKALATSSGAAAGVLGRLDGFLSREESLAHAEAIAAAVETPVSADLERGFGDSPEDVAKTLGEAISRGLAGASIEDATINPQAPLYPFSQAVERIEAAVATARSSGTGFMVTARTENFLRGNPDLDDTIRRLQAFERAGADVLFAPGLPSLDAVRTVCASVTRPVNFMAGIPGRSFTVAELTAAGVKRISLASSLHSAAMSAVVAAAEEVLLQGTFGYLDHLAPAAKVRGVWKRA
jgi:2-methylisocitrate lyase-like PEP mutase family enzyme